MILEKLFDEMNVTEHFDKVVVTAMVLDTLKANDCGVTAENEANLVNTLIDGVCTKYELQVMLLGTYWSNDMADLLEKHLNLNGKVYKDYIWKFLTENEIYPGVKMS